VRDCRYWLKKPTLCQNHHHQKRHDKPKSSEWMVNGYRTIKNRPLNRWVTPCWNVAGIFVQIGFWCQTASSLKGHKVEWTKSRRNRHSKLHGTNLDNQGVGRRWVTTTAIQTNHISNGAGWVQPQPYGAFWLTWFVKLTETAQNIVSRNPYILTGRPRILFKTALLALPRGWFFLSTLQNYRAKSFTSSTLKKQGNYACERSKLKNPPCFSIWTY